MSSSKSTAGDVGRSRVAKHLAAKKIAKRCGISPAEVFARWNAGLVWSESLGWVAEREREADANRQLRERAKADGNCIRCLRNPVRAGAKHCQDCLSDRSMAKRKAKPQ